VTEEEAYRELCELVGEEIEQLHKAAKELPPVSTRPMREVTATGAKVPEPGAWENGSALPWGGLEKDPRNPCHSLTRPQPSHQDLPRIPEDMRTFTSRSSPFPRLLPTLFLAAVTLGFPDSHAADPAPPFSLVIPAGPGAQEGNSVAVDSSGNIHLTGQFQGNATIGGVNLTNAGTQDFFLASFTRTGQPRWTVAAGTSGSDYGNSVKVAANGDLLVAGSLFTPLEFLGTSLSGPGGRDAVLARITRDGTLLWARAVGSSGTDEGDEVAEDSQGNILLVGRISGPGTIGAHPVGSAGRTRIFLARFSAAGDPLQATDVTSETVGAGSGVAIDGNDNVLVTGQDTIGGERQIMVTKFNPSGQRLWSVLHPGNSSSLGTGIRTDAQNNVYVCGTFATTSVTFGDTTLDNPNFALRGFLAKYGPDGTPLWARRIGGRAYRLALHPDGTAHTCGFFLGTSGNFDSATLNNRGAQDGFVTRHDATGQLAWVKHAGSESGDILRNITLSPDGNVFVSGEGDAPAFDLQPFTLPGRVAVARLEVNVAPPTPALSLTRAGDQLILAWPPSDTGYIVQTSASLGQPFSTASLVLTPVPGQPNTFSLSLPDSNLFFRLIKP